MDLSVFLAQALGLYALIIGIALIINHGRYREVMRSFMNNLPLIIISGAMSLIIGLLIVLSHNIWEMDYRVLITILGWLSLIKGVVRTVFPQVVLTMGSKIIDNNAFYYIVSIILIIIGVYLTYMGFWGAVQ